MASGFAAACDIAPQLPAQAPQASLVFARAAPGWRVSIDARPIRVGSEGEFVFAIGRDAHEPVVVQFHRAGAESVRCAVEVVARQWKIERIEGVPPETVTPPPAIAARIAREQARVNAARQRDDARLDFAAGFDWPLQGRQTGWFGSQRIFNGVPKAPHGGLDIAASTGTEVRAPAAGVVTLADADMYLTGGTLLLDHGHGVSSNFLHLSRIDVAVGERVERGQVIGAVGATGRATGPHLHWGMNWFDVRVDPLSVFEQP